MSTSTGLQFEYASGCLIVRVSGRGMIEHKEASIQAIAGAVNAQSVKAALVDLRGLVPPFTFMDRYQIGELTGRYLSETPIAALALENPDGPAANRTTRGTQPRCKTRAIHRRSRRLFVAGEIPGRLRMTVAQRERGILDQSIPQNY